MSDLIRRSDVADKLTRIINEMEEIFSNIRMKLVDDSVCGLCEYDCDHGIDGYANECPGFEKDDCFKLKDEYRKEWTSTKDLPSVEPDCKTGEWIPFTSHEPDAEEKEMYPDYEYVIDGPLPEEGQRILVTIACAGHEHVQEDEFYSDDGCYLDSGYDLISEAIAWMPLPEPYRKENG